MRGPRRPAVKDNHSRIVVVLLFLCLVAVAIGTLF